MRAVLGYLAFATSSGSSSGDAGRWAGIARSSSGRGRRPDHTVAAIGICARARARAKIRASPTYPVKTTGPSTITVRVRLGEVTAATSGEWLPALDAAARYHKEGGLPDGVDSGEAPLGAGARAGRARARGPAHRGPPA